MNKPIRRVSVFCLLLVFALLVRTNWIQGVKASAYATDQHNARVKYDRYAHPRGDIIVSGKPVTKSVFVNGYRYKYRQGWIDGKMYSPITGYSSQAFGSSELESIEDPLLSGADDRLFFRNTLDLLTGKQKQGGDVVTTIDARAQKAAYDGLKGRKGAAVAIDPRTGAILALVSMPSYDPSIFAGQGDTDAKHWNELLNDADQPMLNRALRATYPPGSTFKIVTATAAFENGLYHSVDDRTDTPKHYILPNTRTELRNESPLEPCAHATIMVGLEYSCNTVFGKIGATLGREKMRAQAEKFGFNKEIFTPVRAARSYFPSHSDPAGTAMDSIGQHDTRATPLQMAMVAAAVANNGTLYKPYMVDKELAPNLSVISQTKPQVMSEVMSPDTAQKLQHLMEGVVTSGTGKNAQIPGVTVGGKTGTAQHGENNQGLPYAWFISYAMQGDSSPVAVAVVVEDGAAQRNEITGGGLAAPVAKSIMEAVLNK